MTILNEILAWSKSLAPWQQQETGNLRRVIFEIGVLNNDHLALSRLDASAYGCCLACILLQMKWTNSLVGAGRFGDNRRRPVGRAVIDDDHFESLDRQRQEPFQRSA